MKNMIKAVAIKDVIMVLWSAIILVLVALGFQIILEIESIIALGQAALTVYVYRAVKIIYRSYDIYTNIDKVEVIELKNEKDKD